MKRVASSPSESNKNEARNLPTLYMLSMWTVSTVLSNENLINALEYTYPSISIHYFHFQPIPTSFPPLADPAVNMPLIFL